MEKVRGRPYGKTLDIARNCGFAAGFKHVTVEVNPFFFSLIEELKYAPSALVQRERCAGAARIYLKHPRSGLRSEMPTALSLFKRISGYANTRASLADVENSKPPRGAPPPPPAAGFVCEWNQFCF
ncbi:hypothetical protein EVAR_31642_1 [Eumeta japonica]|uniref:Uncharacterized protein n=1 Tax=Eumeta variegata TaxID=151549 RepID=A0A4C1VYT5_EUMVA|nr:hypothetical protein EVAR_31642_1 [Eumeta japonica]